MVSSVKEQESKWLPERREVALEGQDADLEQVLVRRRGRAPTRSKTRVRVCLEWAASRMAKALVEVTAALEDNFVALGKASSVRIADSPFLWACA